MNTQTIPAHSPSEMKKLTDLQGTEDNKRASNMEAQKEHSPSQDETPNNETFLDFKKNERWGARHTLVTMCFLLTALKNMTRFNTSIAIVSMVGGPDSHRSNLTGTHSDVCPWPNNTSSSQDHVQEGEFDWDETMQGLILGAYFYGNVLTNIVGGRIAERVGAKPVILWTTLASSVITLLSPATVRLSTHLFIAMRLCLGMVQGMIMPALTRCLLSWVPPFKRSKYTTIVHIGAELGLIITLSLGGWFCDQDFLGGWPAIFYVFGALELLWCLAWAFLVTDRPENHKTISEEERKYLMTRCTLKKGKTPPIPWRQIMTSLPVWSIIVMHVGSNWGYYTFVTELPLYLANIQHFSIKSNGLLSALPFACNFIFGIVYSLVMDRVTASGKLSILRIRQLSMIIASYFPALLLVILCLVGCDHVAAVVVLCLAVGLTSTTFCGLFSSHQDISPNFSATLYGISNTLANCTGFLVPAVVGIITLNNQTLAAWNIVFLLTTLMYTASCTFYIFSVSDEIQAFNDP